MKKTPIVISLITCFIFSCKTPKTATTVIKENAVTCNNSAVNYTNDIQPIFDKSCNNCHNSRKIAGGYDFTTIGPIVQSVKDNKLLGVIKWEHGFMKMPMRAKQLDSTTIYTIECWIKNGMKQ